MTVLFYIFFPIVGLIIYNQLGKPGKIVMQICIWASTLIAYYFLYWIWLDVLSGMAWLQWFFGFLVILFTTIPILVYFGLSATDNLFKKAKQYPTTDDNS